jgi:tetratricopeptide (TPR) repeat protein
MIFRFWRSHSRAPLPLHPGYALRLITALTVALLSIALAAEEAGSSVDALVARGEAQLAARDIDGAVTTLTEAVEADPQSTLAHTRLGGAYLLGQRYTAAIEQFQQAIGIAPDNAAAFIGMGMAYLHGGQAGPAKAAFTEAKRLDPDKAADLDALIGRIDQDSAIPRQPHP